MTNGPLLLVTCLLRLSALELRVVLAAQPTFFEAGLSTDLQSLREASYGSATEHRSFSTSPYAYESDVVKLLSYNPDVQIW